MQDPDEQVAVSQSVISTINQSELITSEVARIEKLKQDLAKHRDMLQGIFENDPTYQLHDAAVKEATKVRSGTKKQIMRLPQAVDLVTKVADIRSQIKDLNKSLSQYLQEYEKTTGQTTIETADGQVRQIIYTARLVKSSEL